MEKGIFISLEGPDGSGKTTIFNMIGEKLINEGYPVLLTREPGGIPISEQIREIILNKKNTSMDGKTEALLYAAARRQHLIEKVVPALKEGKIVITDRFIDSSLAYQGHARGLGIDEVKSINKFAIGKMMPQLTLYFDLDPKIGLQRINKNKSREINRLDLEQLSFHNKVRAGYLLLLKKYPDRIVKIDANNSVEKVYNLVEAQIDNFLKNRLFIK